VPDPREPIEAWIDEALVADVLWMRSARAIVFVSPSRDQVRSMLEAAAPLIAAAERERIILLADSVQAVATADEGTRCFFADLLRQSWPEQKRSDEKESTP